METELLDFIKKNNIEVLGIIQVGANTGQEMETFRTLTNNIMCFEPIPEVFEILSKNHPDVIPYNFALGDKEETKDIFIATNNFESSSFLSPKNHTKFYPQIRFNLRKNISIKRFDELNIEIKDCYNVLVSDTQGYEINVLKGFGDKIKFFDIIYVEYINSQLYENDSSLLELSNYLSKFNFKLEITTPETNGSGNGIFKKYE